MDNIIKERINKIGQGIVPDGYKGSKIGIIPEDWEVRKLKEMNYINKKNINTNDINSYFYYDLSSINNGSIIKPKEKIDYNDLPSRAKRIFEKGDILLSTVRPNLKGFGYIDFEPSDSICSTGFAVLKNKKQYNNKYVFYNLFTKRIENKINSLTVGSNYPALNITEVNNLHLAMPSLQEQEKIADILSTWDKAIEKIEKLIKEKDIQKKGLMQQLLTGETRLPGFNGEWEEVKLGDVVNFNQGYQVPVKNQFHNKKNDSYKRFIRIIDITQKSEEKRYIKVNKHMEEVSENDLFMIRYGTPGVIAMGYNGIIANNLFMLLPKIEIYNLYLYLLLNLNYSQ